MQREFVSCGHKADVSLTDKRPSDAADSGSQPTCKTAGQRAAATLEGQGSPFSAVQKRTTTLTVHDLAACLPFAPYAGGAHRRF
jgi:hypothetical protein